MIHEKSCGAVVFYRGSKVMYLLEKMIQGHYALCKGHVEGNETEKQTAAREIKEETGLDVAFYGNFRETVEYSPYSGCVKEVVYFIAEANTTVTRRQPEEVSELMWMDYDQAMRFITFESDRQILAHARAAIE